jgi:hypothetical protein
MLYMVIERFKNADPVPVYRRFQERGRIAPDGLVYVASWVTADLSTCYQVMACDDAALLEQWMARWRDVVDFDVIPVITSADAVERLAPHLARDDRVSGRRAPEAGQRS